MTENNGQNLALVHAYSEYRKLNAQIKEKHRKERERKLRDVKAALGHAIVEAQAMGTSMADISRLLGLKNRTFFYDAKRAYHGLDESEQSKYQTATTDGGDNIEEILEAELDSYWKELVPGLYEVGFGDPLETYTVEFVDGVLSLPDEWLDITDATEKKIIRNIIREIEESYANVRSEV